MYGFSVCGHASHYMCVEVRGQLYGVGFLFLPLCELLGQCQAARLVGQVLLCIEPSHQLLVVIYICLQVPRGHLLGQMPPGKPYPPPTNIQLAFAQAHTLNVVE